MFLCSARVLVVVMTDYVCICGGCGGRGMYGIGGDLYLCAVEVAVLEVCVIGGMGV